jgi:hypothetical protein
MSLKIENSILELIYEICSERSLTNFSFEKYEKCITTDLKFVRSMGSKKDMNLISANLGAYEVVLLLLKNPVEGLPVYKAIFQSESTTSSQSGILKRIKMMRDAGLIGTVPGKKGSEVCLVPSKKLLNNFLPLLIDKHQSYNMI